MAKFLKNNLVCLAWYFYFEGYAKCAEDLLWTIKELEKLGNI